MVQPSIKENTLMRRMTVFVLSLLVILSSAFQLSAQKMEIGGSFIDGSGTPVKDGIITPFQIPESYIGDVNEFWRPVEDGYFGFAIDWKPKKKIWLLMEEAPKGFYPISGRELLNKKFFKGVIISKYSKDVDLGKIKDYIRYGKAIIDVSSHDAIIEKIQKHKIFVKIRDAEKQLISETSFMPGLSEDQNRVVFNLPEGFWYIELIDKSNNTTIMPNTSVKITNKLSIRLLLNRTEVY